MCAELLPMLNPPLGDNKVYLNIYHATVKYREEECIEILSHDHNQIILLHGYPDISMNILT